MEDFNVGIDMNCDFDVDFNLDDFDLQIGSFDLESRYMKPKLHKQLPDKCIKYEYAQKMAKDMIISKGDRYNIIISGNFIFGDFIEAYVVEHNVKVKKMTISTLSMSQDNVDSLANLINGGYVDEMNLIISHYFYSHERHSLVPYIYKNLDVDGKFQLAVAGTHTKTCIIETEDGLFITIHGSSNLRSSRNIEQFTIEENEEYYKFLNEYQDTIINEFKTINKGIRGGKLWNLIK